MRKHLILYFILASSLSYFSAQINAQCTVESSGFPSEQSTFYVVNQFGPDGQTFVACQTGLITSISFKMDANSNITDTLRLFVSNGVDAMFTNSPFNQLYTIQAPLNGVQTIVLDFPFWVETGQTYTFGLRGPLNATQPILDAGLNTYSDGDPIPNGVVSPGLADLNFSIAIEFPFPICGPEDDLIGFTDEIIGTHVSALSYPGVVFESSNPSTMEGIGHTISIGPGICTNVNFPLIEGPAADPLSLKFDACIECLSFGFALNSISGPVADAVIVKYYTKSGFLLGSISADADSNGCGFIEGSFTDMPEMPYEAEISFNTDAFDSEFQRIGIDNISYTLSESCKAIPTLSQWGIIALGMIMLILGAVTLKKRKIIFG